MRREFRKWFCGLAFPASTILAVFCAACAPVGPNYAEPEVKLSEQWNNRPGAGLSAESTDLRELSSWWTVFNDPLLSELIESAIRGSLDVKKARAKVREARARRGIAKAGLFPVVDASGSYVNSRGSEEIGGGDVQELHSIGLDASWEIDLFGGVRRSVEAAQGDLDARREELHGALVSLTAEVGLNYVEARAFQARLAALENNVKAQEETLQLTRFRLLAGLTSDLAVQQAKYNLESAKSQVPTLRIGLEECMNRISVLLGEQPGSVRARMADPRPVPTAPAEVAVGVPADVLRQRPDVRMAERELAAQTARVGVATAELYPKLTLNGSIGLDAFSVGELFLGSAHGYSLGPRLGFPVFNAGAIRQNIEAQSALQEQALINYEASILTALEEVENALASYTDQQIRRASLAGATEAARSAADLAEKQYLAGQSDFNDVLDAQRSLLSFQDQLAQIEGEVTSTVIRLYKALGGGWTQLAPEVESNGERKDK